MSLWKKTMFYLGLGPDEDYENAPPPTGMAPEAGMTPPQAGISSIPDIGEDGAVEPSAVRALGPMEGQGRPGPIAAARMPSVSTLPSAGAGTSGINTVRPLPASNGSASKPHIVSPRAFNDAQEVADRFRGHAPVIMNLQDVERDLSRRLIDFASGLCYGLGGQMEKVGDRVYLLMPDDVVLSPEARRELHEQGLHNG